jgi:hypothetical protein
MALVPYDPELDDVVIEAAYPAYESDPQVPEDRVAVLPDQEQHWSEVHPGGYLELKRSGQVDDQ